MSRATPRSRRNFFQSLLFVLSVMSVTIWSTPRASSAQAHQAGAFVAGHKRKGDERREFRRDRSARVEPGPHRRLGPQIAGVVGLDARPRRRRAAQEGVGVADAREPPDERMGRQVPPDRPRDAGPERARGRPRCRSRSRPARRRGPPPATGAPSGSRRPRGEHAFGRPRGTRPCRCARPGRRGGTIATRSRLIAPTTRQNPSARRSRSPAATAASIRSSSRPMSAIAAWSGVGRSGSTVRPLLGSRIRLDALLPGTSASPMGGRCPRAWHRRPLAAMRPASHW